jgi:hypothetical protein
MNASEFVSLAISVVGFLGVIVANRFTSRTAKSAQEITAAAELAKATQSRDDGWRSDNVELRKAQSEYRERIDHLSDRVDSLEDQNRMFLREKNDIIIWARKIVDLLKNSGIPYPPAPPGVLDTDPGMRSQP